MTTGNILKVWEDKEKYYASILVVDDEKVEHIVELSKEDFDDNTISQDIKNAFIDRISEKFNLENKVDEVPEPKPGIDFSEIVGEIELNSEIVK